MKKLLPVILGIGFLHQLLFLGARQLWTDELMQALMIQSASPGEILKRLHGGMDLASPLDFLVQRGVTSLLGDAAWALRLHAMVFGTLSIWIFYRLARFLFGERPALYSTLLFTFYPLAYRYGLEGRPYALLLFLSLLSYDLVLRQIYDRGRSWRGWVGIAIVSTLLLYTNFLGGLILMSQFAGLLLNMFLKRAPRGSLAPNGRDQEGWEACLPRKSHAVAFFLAGASACVLFYPWVWYEWARPRLSPASEIVEFELLLRLIKGLGDNSYPVAALLLAAAILGAFALYRHGRRRSLAWLWTWFLLPIPLLLAVEIWAGYFFSIRHLLHVTPPLVMLAGYGMSSLGPRWALPPQLPPRLSLAAKGFAAIFISAGLWIGWLRAHAEPTDWFGVASYVNNMLRPGDAVSMPGVDAYLKFYYPRLASFQVEGLAQGQDSRGLSQPGRKIIVCYEQYQPAPCGSFPEKAREDPSWEQRAFKGFTVFVRGR